MFDGDAGDPNVKPSNPFLIPNQNFIKSIGAPALPCFRMESTDWNEQE